jgi:hypothetical protein
MLPQFSRCIYFDGPKIILVFQEKDKMKMALEIYKIFFFTDVRTKWFMKSNLKMYKILMGGIKVKKNMAISLKR